MYVVNANGCESCACMKIKEVPIQPVLPVLNSACMMPRAIGPCRAAHPRFFYDNVTQTCKPFIYGGCHGNKNNFLSLDMCQITCMPVAANKSVIENTKYERCFQTVKVGECKGNRTRYFYNETARVCQAFTYSGCRGNRNNFKSEKCCNSTCTEPLATLKTNSVTSKAPTRNDKWLFKMAIFSSPDLSSPSKSSSFSSLSSSFPLGFQKALDNNEHNLCELKAEPGMCRASMDRFFYNPKTDACEKFVYGGCGGNKNNFVSEAKCLKRCQNSSISSNSSHSVPRIATLLAASDVNTSVAETWKETKRCMIEKDAGPCKQELTRYFFNRETKQCEMFLYGGCLGNKNNFETLEACNNECSAAIGENDVEPDQNECEKLPDSGMCRAFFERFYYDPRTKKCEQFVYGGCGGNLAFSSHFVLIIKPFEYLFAKRTKRQQKQFCD